MTEATPPSQYSPTFNMALQWLWGDGFLSPGGPDEVAHLIRDLPIAGAVVVDVGSGLGAADMLLVEDYEAEEVLGLDVEQHLIDESQDRADAAGLGDQLSYRLIEPGPLPLEDDCCDVVFTKDAIVHMPDKPAFYAEVRRILRPGGLFVGSDWLRGGPETDTDRAKAWLEFVHLDFKMQTIDELRSSLEEAGFERLRLDDRNEWYQEAIKSELAAVSGDRYEQLVDMIGADDAGYRQRSSQLKQQAIDDGFLRPTHFAGYTPAVS